MRYCLKEGGNAVINNIFAALTWQQAMVYSVLIIGLFTLVAIGKVDWSTAVSLLTVIASTGVAADATIRASRINSTKAVENAGTSTPTPDANSKA